jgi:acetyltransferase-like isoleucine patch superfamily enzyme
MVEITLRRRLKQLIWGPPRHVSSWGAGALILRPRRIRGAARLEVGTGVTVDAHSWIAAYTHYAGHRYDPSIQIGDRVTIGRYFCLTAINKVQIGADCLFSEYVYISDHAHGLDPGLGPPVEQGLESKGPVIIGARTFLGYRACIMPGVVLGEHCVVGANSVVTRSFPSYSMVAGAPARLIKTFNAKSHAWEKPAEHNPHA